jgi:RNA polymerase sigma-70 factor, ECF subfamily
MERSDQIRWQDLYVAHAGRLYVFASRRVGREDAADVVAETFLVAWRKIEDVPQQPLPWLYAVARNVIGNVHRASHRREALDERLRRSTIERVADPSADVDVRRDLLTALRLLPEAERTALALATWDDLDGRSAAALLGCSPGTFAVRIHRGRRHLRELLAADVA